MELWRSTAVARLARFSSSLADWDRRNSSGSWDSSFCCLAEMRLGKSQEGRFQMELRNNEVQTSPEKGATTLEGEFCCKDYVAED